uniref:Uncharacterized protein n=1 Tax=Anguilla anguilla TaxID=7936 RepID=A0A0E9RK71_ANGAN
MFALFRCTILNILLFRQMKMTGCLSYLGLQYLQWRGGESLHPKSALQILNQMIQIFITVLLFLPETSLCRLHSVQMAIAYWYKRLVGRLLQTVLV